MLKVKSIKYPTTRQMSNIVANLTEKFGKGVKLSCEIHTYDTDLTKIVFEFWFHPGNGECLNLDSWKKVLAKYRGLIEKGV